MLHGVHGAGAPVVESSAMPEQRDQNYHEGDRSEARTHCGTAGARIGILTALPAIPDFSDAHENQDEWPVGQEDRHWVKGGMPVAVKHDRANRDEEDRKNQRSAPGSTVFSHHTPLHSVLR